jgi:hypothetical protein
VQIHRAQKGMSPTKRHPPPTNTVFNHYELLHILKGVLLWKHPSLHCVKVHVGCTVRAFFFFPFVELGKVAKLAENTYFTLYIDYPCFSPKK